MTKKITKAIAQKVLDIVDAGLIGDIGDQPIPGQVCVEQAVCIAMGEPLSDEPSCVSPAFRAFKITLNDANWSSPSARAAGMRELAVVQLGSLGMDEQAFAKGLAEMVIRGSLARCMRALAITIPSHAEDLNAAALRCETEGSESAAGSAYSAAKSAAYSAAKSAAYSAQSAAWNAWNAWNAYSAAKSAQSAAYSASSHSAAVSANSAAVSASHSAARDNELATTAKEAVELCVKLKLPGVRFLALARKG